MRRYDSNQILKKGKGGCSAFAHAFPAPGKTARVCRVNRGRNRTFLKVNMVGAVDDYTQAENTSGEELLLFGTRPSQALVPLFHEGTDFHCVDFKPKT